jgi:acyl-coenzyme A thioesterase PaaI-like protein
MQASASHENVRARVHPGCVACSPTNPKGLQLQFQQNVDGSVSTSYLCDPSLEGYPGFLHGGIIALIFDSVMVNCLFARGYQALTAELKLRYTSPVQMTLPVDVHARVTKDMHPLYLVEAAMTQDGSPRARADGKFMVV